MTINDMRESLIGQLTPYLRKTDKTFDEELLASIVDGVLTDARQYRRYPSTYPEETVLSDMATGLGTFRRVALFRYNKIGVENETSHTEGEVSRKFIDDGKEWAGWLPLGGVLQ